VYVFFVFILLIPLFLYTYTFYFSSRSCTQRLNKINKESTTGANNTLNTFCANSKYEYSQRNLEYIYEKKEHICMIKIKTQLYLLGANMSVWTGFQRSKAYTYIVVRVSANCIYAEMVIILMRSWLVCFCDWDKWPQLRG